MSHLLETLENDLANAESAITSISGHIRNMEADVVKLQQTIEHARFQLAMAEGSRNTLSAIIAREKTPQPVN